MKALFLSLCLALPSCSLFEPGNPSAEEVQKVLETFTDPEIRASVLTMSRELAEAVNEEKGELIIAAIAIEGLSQIIQRVVELRNEPGSSP